MAPTAEISAVSLVVVGKFNPAIFSPAWFQRTEIVSQETALNAVVKIIAPQVAAITLGNIDFHCEESKMQVATSVAPWSVLADFVIGLLPRTLVHTPILQLGINYEAHFNLGSIKARDNLALKLTPFSAWGDHGKNIADDLGKGRSGLTKMAMRYAGERQEKRDGWLDVVIEPSVQIPDGGVYMFINDHYSFGETPSSEYIEELERVLGKKFDESISNSKKIMKQIIGD